MKLVLCVKHVQEFTVIERVLLGSWHLWLLASLLWPDILQHCMYTLSCRKGNYAI